MSTNITRQQLIYAAEEMLKEGGLAEFNMRDLAARCGVSVGTVYNNFPSKNYLIAQLMHALIDRCNDEFMKTESDDLIESLLNLYKATCHFMDGFQQNLMAELVNSVASANNNEFKRWEHFSVFNYRVGAILESRREQIGKLALSKFTMPQLVSMVMKVFLIYINNNSRAYDELSYIWTRMLKD